MTMDARALKTPGQILEAALAKENAARDFYAELAHQCHVDFVKELLVHLQVEEEKHAALIRKMIARLGR